MKNLKILKYFIVTSLMSFFFQVFFIFADTDEIKESLFEQLTRGVVRIEEHQSVCVPGLEWSFEQNIPKGTGFFLHYNNSEKSEFYIVTARHVVDKRADLFARVRISGDSNEYVILLLPRDLWVFNPAAEKTGYLPVDVAVMKIKPTNFIKTFRFCEDNENCGEDDKGKQLKNQIGESPTVMDRAIFFGFPGGDVAKESLEPFARSGVVAYTAFNPAFKIGGKLVPEDSIYYIDAPAFGGNSGGPVMREPLPLQGDVKLWGLITGANSVGRDYAIATRPEKIKETIKYATKVAVLNENGWQRSLPSLPIKCESDVAEKAGK